MSSNIFPEEQEIVYGNRDNDEDDDASNDNNDSNDGDDNHNGDDDFDAHFNKCVPDQM